MWAFFYTLVTWLLNGTLCLFNGTFYILLFESNDYFKQYLFEIILEQTFMLFDAGEQIKVRDTKVTRLGYQTVIMPA